MYSSLLKLCKLVLLLNCLSVFLVNTSIGCLHTWGLSEEPYRQTRCTLCNLCCEKGRSCPFNGVSTTYAHQCGCGTIIIGCRDCGICQECAETLWVSVTEFEW